MSGKIMGQVWDLDLPHQKLLVLLAMTDHADHNGENIFPGIGLIAWKTGYSPRQVQRIIQQLTAEGLLVLVEDGQSRGIKSKYRVNLKAGNFKPPYQRRDQSYKKGDKMSHPKIESTFRSGDDKMSHPTKEEPRQNVTPGVTFEQSEDSQNVIPGVTFQAPKSHISPANSTTSISDPSWNRHDHEPSEKEEGDRSHESCANRETTPPSFTDNNSSTNTSQKATESETIMRPVQQIATEAGNKLVKQGSQESETSQFDPLWIAFIKLMNLDPRIYINNREFNDFYSEFKSIGATEKEVEHFGNWFRVCHWLGRRGEKPKIREVREHWKDAQDCSEQTIAEEKIIVETYRRKQESRYESSSQRNIRNMAEGYMEFFAGADSSDFGVAIQSGLLHESTDS